MIATMLSKKGLSCAISVGPSARSGPPGGSTSASTRPTQAASATPAARSPRRSAAVSSPSACSSLPRHGPSRGSMKRWVIQVPTTVSTGALTARK